MNIHVRTKHPLIITLGEQFVAEVKAAGFKSCIDGSSIMAILKADGSIRDEHLFFDTFVILIPRGAEEIRDTIAINLGDERCLWAYIPEDPNEPITNAILSATRMWTDEVARLSDIPHPGEELTYETGFWDLDRHGFRITTPAFMPVIGPYGSGKSVLLRQLLVQLWRKHGWKFALTSFEERVRPRYERDLKRHLIGKPVNRWTPEEDAAAEKEVDDCCVFIRRARNTEMSQERLFDRIRFAARAHGVRVVAIDPVNEIDHQVPPGMSKTDYMGRFIMRLKAIADDHNLLMIVCAHPPKDGVEKRLQKDGLLTLNDGADTAHWGNKADIGWAVWRSMDGPTMLHVDKIKDHETMGKPTLCELVLDPSLNKFRITRMGYEILADGAAQ